MWEISCNKPSFFYIHPCDPFDWAAGPVPPLRPAQQMTIYDSITSPQFRVLTNKGCVLGFASKTKQKTNTLYFPYF